MAASTRNGFVESIGLGTHHAKRLQFPRRGAVYPRPRYLSRNCCSGAIALAFDRPVFYPDPSTSIYTPGQRKKNGDEEAFLDSSSRRVPVEQAVRVIGGSKMGVMTTNAKWAFTDSAVIQRLD